MESLYRYRLSSTGYSSARLGPCEICGKHASEVFIQAEQKRYRRHDGTLSWTYADCIDSCFGHKECLENQQREPKIVDESRIAK